MSFAPYSISQWLIGGRRGPIRPCWKNSKASVLPVLPGFSLFVQLRPSLPFIASFLPLVSISPVFCPLTLHLSLQGTLGRRSVLPPFNFSPLSACLLHVSAHPPHLPSPSCPPPYTCLSGRLSLLSRGEFSQWAQMEGLFQLCLHKDHMSSFLTKFLLDEGLFDSTGVHIVIGFLESFVWVLIWLFFWWLYCTVTSHQAGTMDMISLSTFTHLFFSAGLRHRLFISIPAVV